MQHHARQTLAFQRIRTQCQATDQDSKNELKRIELGMGQRKLDESQDHERHTEKHAIVPRESDRAVKSA